MVKLLEKYYKTASGVNIEEYLIDTDAEVADLPKAPAGSFAVSAETGTVFYANSNGEWTVKE